MDNLNQDNKNKIIKSGSIRNKKRDKKMYFFHIENNL